MRNKWTGLKIRWKIRFQIHTMSGAASFNSLAHKSGWYSVANFCE